MNLILLMVVGCAGYFALTSMAVVPVKSGSGYYRMESVFEMDYYMSRGGHCYRNGAAYYCKLK